MEDVRAENNAGFGIVVERGGVITGSQANRNGGGGFGLGEPDRAGLVQGATLVDSSAFGNRLDGIHARRRAVIVDTRSNSNGEDGIEVEFGTAIRGVTASENGLNGIRGMSASIQGAVASVNGNTGISTTGSIFDSVATGNGNFGVSCAGSCSARGNEISGNSATEGGGIYAAGIFAPF